LEAINFGDLEREFSRYKTVVYGISPDDCICHAAFLDKHGLTVQLLSDDDGQVCRSYDVLEERENDGMKKLRVHRCTIVIDRDGIVRHIIRNIKPKVHAREVLNLMKEIN
jgi:peroxiredoxin Q/BCP